ncbi:MAG: ABC transporter permease, partial [Oscillospiraceae bacterium]|nr:ABC transporter permease [Oscillospiraceae bacterium]
MVLSVLREIKSTLARYLAIFAIIALGVGFFAGLRISTDAMLSTADAYFQEKELYDFRLVSTLGLTREDVEAFAGLEGVEKAIGSVNADFLCRSEDGDIVLRAHLLTEEMNRLDLAAGRLPRAGDECVLDALFFGEEYLGTVLAFSEENTEDTFSSFAYDAYTVVGLVNAPYYANFERGTSALGQGKLSGFIYLPAEGFDTEIYTEIFLTLTEGGKLYSDAYEAAVDGMKPSVTSLLEQRAQLRYDSLESDALSQIEDAQGELDEGWDTYRTERADAEKELAEALEELNSARRELDEGLDRLSAGQEELAEKKAETQAELAKARRELDEGWAALKQGRSELDSRRE